MAACCALHNICETRGENFEDQWMQDVDNVLLSGSSTDGIHDDGRDIRQAIVSYFSE